MSLNKLPISSSVKFIIELPGAIASIIVIIGIITFISIALINYSTFLLFFLKRKIIYTKKVLHIYKLFMIFSDRLFLNKPAYPYPSLNNDVLL